MWLWRSRWFRIVIWVIWMIQWHIHTNIQLSEFELSVSWSSWHKKCFQRMFRSKCFKQMQSWLKLDDFVYSAWKAWNIYWVSQNWSIGALISHYELITSKESCPRLWKDLGQPWVEVRTYWDQWVWIFVLFGALSSPEGHRNDGGGLDLCLPDLRQWHLLDWHETVLLESSVLQACNKTVIDLFSNVFGVSWTGGCIFDVTSSGWVSSIYQRLCWQLIVLCTLGCIERFYWSIGRPSRVSRVNLGGWYEYTIVIPEEVGHDHSQISLQEASSRSELVCSYAVLCPSNVGQARISMQR